MASSSSTTTPVETQSFISRWFGWETTKASTSANAVSSSAATGVPKRVHETLARTLCGKAVRSVPRTSGLLGLIHARTERQLKQRLSCIRGSNRPSDIDKLGYEATLQNYCRQVFENAQVKVGQSSLDEERAGILAKAQEKVDTALFCARCDLEQTARTLKGENPDVGIAALTRDQLQLRKKALLDFCDVQNRYLFQFGAETYCHKLPIVMAQALVTSNGLALGMIPAIQEVMLPAEKGWFGRDGRPEFQQYADRQLSKLAEYAARGPAEFQRIQSDIMKISEPADKPELRILIEASLGLEPGSDLKAEHTRTLTMADYLLDPRQVETGTCFVERQQILVNAYRPDVTFADDYCIFKYGGMVRAVDGEKKVFHFTPQMADSSLLMYQHTIQPDGSIPSLGADKATYVWEVPGIKAALRQARIANTPSVRKRMLEILVGDAAKVCHAKDILDAYAKAYKERVTGDYRSLKDVQSAAYFGYTALIRFPLQRCKIEMMAALSAQNGPREAQITDCVAKTLNELANSLVAKEVNNPLHVQAVETLTRTFMQTLSRMIILSYENLGDVDTLEDGEGSSGQWVLRVADGSDQGKRMDSPADFQGFLLDVAQRSWKNCRASELDTKVRAVYATVDSAIQEAVNTKDFVNRCFIAYSPSEHVEDPFTQWTELEHTPIRDKDGGSLSGPIDNFWNVSTPRLQEFTAESAQQALEQINQFVMDTRRKAGYGEDPFAVGMPMVIPGHAINFIPDHRMGRPRLVADLIRNGQKVAGTPIGAQTMEAIRSSCFKFLPDDVRSEAREGLRKQLTDSETLNSYCNKLLSCMLSYVDDADKAAMTKKVCDQVLSVLQTTSDQSAEQFRQLAHGAIRLADLNWDALYTGSDGVFEVHAQELCIYFDPTLGELQVGAIGDDDSLLVNRDATFIPGMWGAFTDSADIKKIPNPLVELGLVSL